jgi:uncharacterized protein YndB with AHSA1/START domain
VAELVVTVDVNAPVGSVWAELVDWDTHDEWMLLTRVTDHRVPDGKNGKDGKDGVGTSFIARTGIGRLHFADSMTVTQWDPPRRCIVQHTGRLVRGSGSFEVEPRPEGGSRIVWSEWLRMPLGPVGELAWLGGRPLAAVFLRSSLNRLARLVEARVGQGGA